MNGDYLIDWYFFFSAYTQLIMVICFGTIFISPFILRPFVISKEKYVMKDLGLLFCKKNI